MSATRPVPQKKHGFWRRHFGDPILQQLTQGVSAQKIAFTIALCTGLSVFPILGSTTFLCFIAGVAFSLNQPIAQSMNLLGSLCFLPLLVVFIKLGDVLTGASFTSLNIPAMIRESTHEPAKFLKEFGGVALRGMLGWSVVMVFWMPIVYFSSLPILKRYRPAEAK
jgi:uncharacterized protein (DUF2062 family)